MLKLSEWGPLARNVCDVLEKSKAYCKRLIKLKLKQSVCKSIRFCAVMHSPKRVH